MTTLTKNQKITRTTEWEEGANRMHLTATVRHDDECGNGHNTFAITGELRENGRWSSGGCLHEIIAQRIPELAPYIKWHLCSTDGPMHYVANTAYHVKNGNLQHARSTAIWPDATDDDLTSPILEQLLVGRLPALMEDFRASVESLGLEY